MQRALAAPGRGVLTQPARGASPAERFLRPTAHELAVTEAAAAVIALFNTFAYSDATLNEF